MDNNIQKINMEEKCDCCGQTTSYLLAMDKGSVHIVMAIAKAVKKKGINAIHPRKEMEGTYLTSNQVGNLTRPRAHGLIAKVKGNAGNYCLTQKGLDFLNGSRIPKYTVMSKVEKRQVGYFEEFKYHCTINSFISVEDYWEGTGFEIKQGSVIRNVPAQQKSRQLRHPQSESQISIFDYQDQTLPDSPEQS